VTTKQIRTEIDKLRTRCPFWEIAYQLARQNEIRLFELGLDETPPMSGTQDASSPKTEPGTPEVTEK